MKGILSLILLTFLFLATFRTAAQDLEPVEDAASAISSVLGSKGKGISKARIVSDTEQSITIELHVGGFEEKSNVRGVVLNKIKKQVADISSEAKPVPAGEGTVELKFQLKPSSAKHQNTFLETDFISFVVSKADGLFADLDLGDDVVFGDTYIFKLTKKWRVNGNEAMLIDVKLTPLKSAASIKQ